VQKRFLTCVNAGGAEFSVFRLVMAESGF
jgi:hypothetical protein